MPLHGLLGVTCGTSEECLDKYVHARELKLSVAQFFAGEKLGNFTSEAVAANSSEIVDKISERLVALTISGTSSNSNLVEATIVSSGQSEKIVDHDVVRKCTICLNDIVGNFSSYLCITSSF